MPPKIVPFSFGDEPFTSGDSAHTVCAAAEGDLPMDINWVFHGQKYSSMMGITTTKVGARSNMLQIESVAAAHSGNYTCTARNNAGTRNYTAVLVVFGTNTRRPKQLPFWNIFLCPESLPRSLRRCFFFFKSRVCVFLSVAPVIGPFGFGDTEYTLGMSAQINCIIVEGDLPIEISWTFHGPSSAMSGIETMKIGSRSSVLNIDSVAADHAGNYTCIARNFAAVRNFTATLSVYGSR